MRYFQVSYQLNGEVWLSDVMIPDDDDPCEAICSALKTRFPGKPIKCITIIKEY